MQTRDSRRPTRRRRLVDLADDSSADDSSADDGAALVRMHAARLAAGASPIARARARRLARRPRDAEEANAVAALVERTILGAAPETERATPAVETVEIVETPRVERAPRRTPRSAPSRAPAMAPAPVEAERPEAEPEAAPRPARIIKRRDDRRPAEGAEPVAPAARPAGTPPGAFSRRRERPTPAADAARTADRERPATRRSAQLAAERLFSSAPARPKDAAPASSRPTPRETPPRRAEARPVRSRGLDSFSDPRDVASSGDDDPFGGLR